jgi:hypothetical protein
MMNQTKIKLKLMKIIFLLINVMILSTNLSLKEKQSESLKILVYNTHGLPEIFINDNPKMRFPIIGNKTQEYSISLIQEDYSHHEEFSSGFAESSKAIRGGLGARLSCPVCTGSGLTSVFNLPEDWSVEVENKTYQACSGWFVGANDCFAFKGFQIIKITLPDDRKFFIVNTHMDAGRRDSDRSARAEQLDHIIKSLNRLITNEALIVAGDLNLSSKSAEDMKLLDNFKDELGLNDAFEGITIDKKWSILDYILYKQGDEVEFKIDAAGEDRSFVTKEGALSDHPALYIELTI